MNGLCYTGIKPLGKDFKVTRSGAVMLVANSREEVIWWSPIKVSKEVMKTHNDWVYFISDDGVFNG